ncbi:MAG: phospholipase D family protein [Candidatus Omnitrophica bacterium]|nr:phospholipase D family protein [Candidatus Omnitrophota bacterium]
MQKHLLKIFLTVLVATFISSCSFLGIGQGKNMFCAFEDLHVYEKISYENSAYSRLVDETFNGQVPVMAGFAPHYVNLLNTGEDAFWARVHLIRNAKKYILLQTYIWDKDETGRFFMKELVAAAQRGVKVRVLIDALGANKDLDFWAYFADVSPNLEVKFYNPHVKRINPLALQMAGQCAFRFDDMNKRMHNKTLIMDDQIAIMGGRNYQNDYFDLNRFRNFKDRDVLLVGPVVKQMTDSFTKYWAFQQSVSAKDMTDIDALIKNKNYLSKITDKTFEFGNLFKDFEDQLAAPQFIEQHFVQKAFRVEHVKLSVDLPGKNKLPGCATGSRATEELLDIMGKAQKQIIFQTPYLILDTYLVKGIRKIQKQNKGLDILISTNSLAATDHITAYAQSYKQKSFFVDALHFRIFELKPVPKDISSMLPDYNQHPEEFFPSHKDSLLEWAVDSITLPQNKRHVCLHAKSFVIDDKIAWVGSFNLDPRSAHLNTEAGLIVWDEAFTRALKENMDLDIALGNSWVVGRKSGFPIIKQLNMIVDKVMTTLPIGDVWPFQHIAMFELKDGADPVPFYDKRFYQNYHEVGQFPEVPVTQGQVQVILLKAFVGLAKPLI